MDTLKHIFISTQNLHHAHVLEGNTATLFSKLISFLENDVQYTTHGNPDFFHASYDLFGVEEGRLLRDMQSRKAFRENQKKIFVVSFNFITHEAQNSLLKVFEEPTEGTHFFILVPRADIFLPTIRSRVQILSEKDTEMRLPSPIAAVAHSFFSASISQRLTLLSHIIEEKEKMQAIECINQLELKLSDLWGHDLDSKKTKVLRELSRSRQYLFDRAPSVKMILEHLALVVPRID